MIDSRQLEMFQQVIDAGSFSAAARALHCSQPAVSQQMRALERLLGGPLFVRVGRALRLTEAGKVLARHSASILGDLAVARRQVQAISALDVGTVRICAFPSANASLVPRAAARLRAGATKLRLELFEQEPPDSFAMLRRAECDVVVGFSYPDTDAGSDASTSTGTDNGDADNDNDGRNDAGADLTAGMTRTPLLTEPLVLLVPVTHRLVDRVRLDAGVPLAPVALAEVAGHTWIAGCPMCRVTFIAACERAGFTPDIVCSTDDNMALQSLVAAGLGVTLVPRLVLAFLRHPDVVALPVEPVMRRRVDAYTWPDLARVDAVRQTLAALTTAAESYR